MDIQKILYRCERNSILSARLVDELLLPLFEEETGTGIQFSERLDREYGHTVAELPQAWHLGVREQFNAYKLFGREGLAKEFKNHPKIKSRSKRERDYLSSQFFRPWRYAFIRVLEDLGNDLFTVINLFSQEEILLYSPGIAQYESEGPHSMYLTLLSDNGLCKQTYGPIAYFRGLQPADVLFYARWVLQEDVPGFAALEEMINADPLHFVVLFIGGNFPLTAKGEDILVIMQSELKLAAVDPEDWRDSFFIEVADGVYQFGLKRWRKPPHFCHCYFSPQDKRLIISAATERGYERLVEELEKLSLQVKKVPDIMVTIAGMILCERILGKKIVLNRYEELFAVVPLAEEQEALDRVNHFLHLLLPYFNSNEPYDLEELAKEAGLDLQQAIGVVRLLEERYRE